MRHRFRKIMVLLRSSVQCVEWNPENISGLSQSARCHTRFNDPETHSPGNHPDQQRNHAGVPCQECQVPGIQPSSARWETKRMDECEGEDLGKQGAAKLKKHE